METRKTNRQIIDSIIKSLLKGPKAINEIASETGINWESVKNHLETLESFGLVSEKPIGKKRIFSARKSLLETNSELRTDTLFGIPIRQEDENMIKYLFVKIKGMWMKKTGKPPGRIQMQKVLSDVDEQCKLDLPEVWYLFGRTCLMTYDPSKEYEYTPIESRGIDNCVKSVVDEKKGLAAWQMKIEQYKQENNQLYKTKEELIRALSFGKLDKIAANRISGLLVGLIASIPHDNEIGEEVTKVAAELSGALIQVLNSNNNLTALQSEMISAFEDLWKLIACYCLYYSLKKNPKYEQENIFDYIRNSYNNQMFFVREHTLSLSEYVIIERDDMIRALQGSIKEMKEISHEERKRMAEEMVNRGESADLFRKSGLDDT